MKIGANGARFSPDEGGGGGGGEAAITRAELRAGARKARKMGYTLITTVSVYWISTVWMSPKTGWMFSQKDIQIWNAALLEASPSFDVQIDAQH